MIELEVKNRNIKVRPDIIRKEGFLPAVFYGKKTTSTPISISQVAFLKTWKKAGESTVITLKHSGGDVEALIHDVDFDPVTGVPRHADFYVFEKDHKLEVSVPLEFVGVSAGVKELGGLLVKVQYDVKIEVLPKDLPQKIEVDISPLVNFGDQILAKDLKLPHGVTLNLRDDEVIALVSEPKAEEVEVVAAPVDLSAIEVEKKGKEKNAEEGEESPQAEDKEVKKENKKESKDK